MTALLKSIELFARLLLAVFDAVFLHEFSCDTARNGVNFKAIILEDHPIILPPIIPKLFWHNVHMPKCNGRTVTHPHCLCL